MEAPQDFVRRVLERLGGPRHQPPKLEERRPLSGGSIHRVEQWHLDDGRRVVVKCGDTVPPGGASIDIFSREAEGLAALGETATLRVPQVLAVDAAIPGSQPFLVLESIETGPRGADFFEDFGHALARLHRTPSRHLGPQGEPFGWPHDNVLGATPQPNAWCADWTTFFARHRLGHQLQLARTGHRGNTQLQRLGEKLLDRLGDWLDAPDEPAACLHGDLWGGNYLVDTAGQAVLIDPAVYCGRREADLAMTRLFGGFEPPFYDAYEEVWPLAPGSEERLAIYELYHLLNHLNLFGEGYLPSCLRVLRRLV